MTTKNASKLVEYGKKLPWQLCASLTATAQETLAAYLIQNGAPDEVITLIDHALTLARAERDLENASTTDDSTAEFSALAALEVPGLVVAMGHALNGFTPRQAIAWGRPAEN